MIDEAQRARWAAEYEKNDQAKADFPDAESFVAYRAADQSGRVRVLGSDRVEARPAPRAMVTPEDIEGWRQEFRASRELQAEFCGLEDAYVGYCRAEREGRVKVYRQ